MLDSPDVAGGRGPLTTGIRASLYNAVGLDSVKALSDYIRSFS